MKKIFLLSILLFQLTFAFGQNQQSGFYTNVSQEAKDNMKYVLDHMRSLKTCEQAKASNDLKLKQALDYLVKNAVYYFAEHKNEIEAETNRIQKLCSSNNNSTTNTVNQNSFKDLQNRQFELVKQIKAIEPNANVGVYEGNIGENETLSIQRSKENINHLEKWLERIKPNSNNSLNKLSSQNQNNNIGNQNTNISNQQSELSKVEQRLKEQSIESQRQDAQRNQAVTEINNKVKEFMQSIPSVKEDQATLDKMKNFEFAKLEVEPEFNTITTPNDFKKVSLTTISYKNLEKTGNVAVSIVTSALSNVDKAKEKAFNSAKIQSSFLGANTLLVKVIEIGTKNLGGPYAFPTTDIFGTAYSDKKINFDLLKEMIETNKNFKIVQCFSHIINSDDVKIEKCKKITSITEITKRDEKIKITANIEGIEETAFTVINFNSKGFTLMYKVDEKKKQKLYNYIVEIE